MVDILQKKMIKYKPLSYDIKYPFLKLPQHLNIDAWKLEGYKLLLGLDLFSQRVDS